MPGNHKAISWGHRLLCDLPPSLLLSLLLRDLQCADHPSSAKIQQRGSCHIMLSLQSCHYLQQPRSDRATACLLPQCRSISCSPAKQAVQLQVAAVRRPDLLSAATASCSSISTINGRPAFPWQLQQHRGVRRVAAVAAADGSSTGRPQGGSSSSSSSSSSTGWDAGSGSSSGTTSSRGRGRGRGRGVDRGGKGVRDRGSDSDSDSDSSSADSDSRSSRGSRGRGSSRGGSSAGRASGRPANNRRFASTSSGSSGKVRVSANAQQLLAMWLQLCTAHISLGCIGAIYCLQDCYHRSEYLSTGLC
jgi:hypothetical protein